MIQYVLQDGTGAEIATTVLSPRPMMVEAVKEWLGGVLELHPNQVGWDEDRVTDLRTSIVAGRLMWRRLSEHPPMSTHPLAGKFF